jgi:hypothetical protein
MCLGAVLRMTLMFDDCGMDELEGCGCLMDENDTPVCLASFLTFFEFCGETSGHDVYDWEGSSRHFIESLSHYHVSYPLTLSYSSAMFQTVVSPTLLLVSGMTSLNTEVMSKLAASLEGAVWVTLCNC